jgi:hypothetical protein
MDADRAEVVGFELENIRGAGSPNWTLAWRSCYFTRSAQPPKGCSSLPRIAVRKSFGRALLQRGSAQTNLRARYSFFEKAAAEGGF